MTAEYNFTAGGLRRVLARQITPAAVWQVLGSDRRVIRRVDPYVLVLGVSDHGQHLVVLVEPTDEGDNEDGELSGWDVLDARELDDQERETFDTITRRQP